MKDVDKVQALEKAVLDNNIPGVRKKFKTLAPFQFTARALAFAMRFAGPAMVETLLDCGATLNYTPTEELGWRYNCFSENGLGRQKDYYKYLFPKALDDLDEYVLTKYVHLTLAPISEADRLEVIRILNERNVIGLHSFLYYSILYDDPAVTEYLRSVGITQLPSPPADLLAGRIKVNEIYTVAVGGYHDELKTRFSESDDEALVRMISALYELIPGKVPAFRYNLLDPKRACSPTLFACAVEKTDLVDKMKRWDIMHMLIQDDNAAGIDYVLKQKWPKTDSDFEFLLREAREKTNPSPEVIALILSASGGESDANAGSGGSSLLDDLSLEPKAALASDIKKIWSYRKLPDDTYEIYSYKGAQTDVVIPAVIGNKPVTAIGLNTFRTKGVGVNARIAKSRKAITSIEFPGSIKEIPTVLLYEDAGDSLETIILGDGITEIHAGAFAACQNLKNVEFPASLKRIGRAAFMGCIGLTTVYLNDGLEYIDELAFYKSGLTEFTAPQSLKSIGEEAFGGCESLASVSIGQSVKIGEGCFSSCSALADSSGIIVVNHKIEGYEETSDTRSTPYESRYLQPLEIGPDIESITPPFYVYPMIMYRPSDAPDTIVDVNSLRAGERIEFGRFPMDRDVALKPISWWVITTTNGQALLLSEKALLRIHGTSPYPPWSDSVTRHLLNGPFLDVAFTDREKEQIVDSKMNPKDPFHYSPAAGQATKDRVFLPSYAGLSKSLSRSSEIWKAKPTEYVIEATPPDDREKIEGVAWKGYVPWPVLPTGFYNEEITPAGVHEARWWGPGTYLRPAMWIRNPVKAK